MTYISEEVSSRVRNGKLVTMDDAGHMSPMERPEAIVKEVRQFLEEA